MSHFYSAFPHLRNRKCKILFRLTYFLTDLMTKLWTCLKRAAWELKGFKTFEIHLSESWCVNLEAFKNCSFYSFYRRSMKIFAEKAFIYFNDTVLFRLWKTEALGLSKIYICNYKVTNTVKNNGEKDSRRTKGCVIWAKLHLSSHHAIIAVIHRKTNWNALMWPKNPKCEGQNRCRFMTITNCT